MFGISGHWNDLLDVLCANGRADVAWRLIFQTECPSWLYQVEKGATTIWEIWDAVAPDGTVSMASFNHYAFGCIGDWLYRFVAGLDKEQPGYKRIRIEPHPHAGLTSARASYTSVQGEITVSWEVQDGQLCVEATIPPNSTALIRLPGVDLVTVQESDAPLQGCEGIVGAWQDGDSVCVEVGSGSYRFQTPFTAPA